MDSTAKWLVKVAGEEVERLLDALPDGLRQRARGVTVVMDPWPSDALVAEGWEVLGSPSITRPELSVLPEEVAVAEFLALASSVKAL